MKFSKILTTLCIALALCCSACKDKLFDFNLNNIEADGEWGIPVFNGSISVGELIQKLDSTNNVQIGENGIVKFILEKELENVVRLEDFMKLDDKQFDSSGVVNFSGVDAIDITHVIQFSLNSSDFTLKHCSVKSGMLTIDFNISNASFAYTADLTSDQILDANDNPISIHFSNTQQHQVVDISNYNIWPNITGNILFNAHVVVPSFMGLQQVAFVSHAELQNIAIRGIECEFQAIAHELNAKTGIKLDFDKLRLNMFQLNNAKASIYVRNNICRMDGTIDQLYLSSPLGDSPLIQSVLSFSAPITYPSDQYFYVNDISIPVLAYNNKVDSLGIQSHLNINPEGFAAGNINLNENSSLDLKIKAELPANISIDNAVYKDTVNNGLFQQLNSPVIQSIEQLTLRIAYVNEFPFEFIPSIEFWNTSTGEVIHLDLKGFQLHGCYNNIPYHQEPLFIELRDTDAQQVANSDKMILMFKVSTQGNTIEIKDSHRIQANIGAKVKYSNINL